MAAAFNSVMSMAPAPMDPPVQTHSRPSMRRKSSAQNLLNSFKPSGQGTGTVSSATGVQFAQIAAAAATREWDAQSLSLQSESVISVGGIAANGGPGTTAASNVEMLRELVKKRIITLTYLRNVHEG